MNKLIKWKLGEWKRFGVPENRMNEAEVLRFSQLFGIQKRILKPLTPRSLL